ncbi:MAG TPA: M1 family aminopeptidase, partial [Actinomycetota bacterium]|nr:M1 family aminopeptidase [Actinomycetota bacterium]
TVSSMVGGTVVDDTALACTEIEVTLDSPLAQGERTTLSMDLEIDVPARNDRFGYHNGLALMGTALPTLEVHDDQGWHHDPFIDLGESFYSIVGRYRVTLNTPEALDTPTSGVVASSTTPVPGRRETTYVAKDVRDFAWAAGRLRRVVGSAGDTRVVVSYQDDAISASEARTALRNAERSLDTFSSSFGTFPYREMDVVLAGFATFGGMEYPTIIFTNPDRFTVSHELAHQYWYGIVGDNEFAEPWLDESFATWSQYLPFGAWNNCSNQQAGLTADITNDMAYWNTHTNQYWVIYSGGGCLLANLAHRFGTTRFVNILEHYAADHWLGVARTTDFKATIEAAAAKHLPGLDMDAYWAAWRVN